MDKNITSNYQQGGITADIVNAEKIEQSTTVSSVKKRSGWHNPWLIGIIGGIIAAVIAGIILNQING